MIGESFVMCKYYHFILYNFLESITDFFSVPPTVSGYLIFFDRLIRFGAAGGKSKAEKAAHSNLL